MEVLRIVRKRFVVDLDKNGAPSGCRFEIERFVRFEDGQEQIVPGVTPATNEEAAAFFGEALIKQAADIEGFKQERDAFKAEAAKELAERDTRIATAAKLNEELTKRLAEAEAKLARIAQADAQYDASVKPLFAQPETRQ